MAEQPIKGSDVIDPKFLDDAIKKAEEFLVINKELTGVLSENLKITSNSLRSAKSDTSAGIKLQAQLTKQAADELKALEVLKQQELKTEQALANVRAANDRALKAQLATEAAFNKSLKDETKSIEESLRASARKNNELQQYKRQLKEVSDRLELNTFRIKQNAIADTESGRVRMRTAALVAQAQKEMFKTVTEVEQGAGRFGRQVGDYKKAYDGLGNSVNQLTRELPAFAVSANTGFLAISNNLPIFFDQLQKINAENKILIEQGKKTQSTLSQLAGAVFSVGSVLSIGVTLLTLYGKELVNWITTLFEGEKALESITTANDAYNKSMNQTKDDITDLTIQLKVQSGILTKQEGDLLKNENARTKALNANKELRKKSIDELKKELEITDELLSLEGKKRTVINDGLREEVDALSNAEKNRIKRYKDGLSEINRLQELSNDYINEEYNLRGKLNKIESDGNKSARERNTLVRDEIIKKRSAADEIRQLEIDNLTDQQEREKQQIAFDADKRIREIDDANQIEAEKKRIAAENYKEQVDYINRTAKNDKDLKKELLQAREKFEKELSKIEADNISPEEQRQLRLQLEIKTNEAILEVDRKFREKEDEENKKQVEKTFEARKKIADDTLNYEIYQLEKTYTDKQKTVSYFNLLEINNLERQISAKKIAQIKADAEEKAALTKNETEKLAIMNEANIAIEKENQKGEEQINANRKSALDKAIKFEIKILDAVAKAEAEKSKLRVEGFDRLISDTEKNIEHQRRLAENGKANTLAFEEEQKRKNELLREQEKQKELKRQKAIAFFKMFSELVGQGKQPAAALGEAAATTYAADAIAGSFIKGTENVERDLKGSKVHNGTDGYVIAVDGKERILNPEQNTKIGALSNEELADLAYRHNNGLLDASLVKMSAYPQNDFAKNVQDSALLMQTMKLNENITDLKDIIKSRPVPSFKVDSLGNVIENIYQNGTTKIIKHINSKKRI